MIRHTWALPLFLAVCALPVFAGTPETFTSDKWGFSANFPYEVKESTSESGSVTLEAGNEADTVAYMISISTLSDEIIRTKEVSQMLEDGIRGAVENVKGQLGSKVAIKIGPYQGREIVINKDDYVAKCRMYIVEKRLVMVMVNASKKAVLPMSAEAFLDSFRLILQ